MLARAGRLADEGEFRLGDFKKIIQAVTRLAP